MLHSFVIMTRAAWTSDLFASFKANLRLKGEEIYKARKNEFSLTSETNDHVLLLLPSSLKSKKPVKVSLYKKRNSVSAKCNCNEFKQSSGCAHIAAAALFLSKVKKEDDKNFQVQKTQPTVSSANNGYELGFLFHTGVGELGFRFSTVLLLTKSNGTTIQRFSGLPQIKNNLLTQFPDEVRELILKIEGGRKEYLNQVFPGIKITVDYTDISFLEGYKKFYWSILRLLWPSLLDYPCIFSLHSPDSFRLENMQKISPAVGTPVPAFYVYKDGRNIKVQLTFSIEGIPDPCRPVSSGNHFFITAGDKYFLLADYDHVKLLEKYKSGFISLPLQSKADLHLNVLTPLRKKYKVEIEPDLDLHVKEVDPQPFVLVAEYLNAYLMLMPHFIYDDKIVAYKDNQQLTGAEDGIEYLVKRDTESEKSFHERLRPLHPSFQKQLQQDFFYVPFQDVMKGSWFLKTIRKLQEEDVQVKGLEQLKKFKHSAKKPTFQLGVSSGIDWFDLEIKFSYEETQVPLKDIQTTILSGQRMVVLGDGSFGVLPEEWLAQFEGVLRMGTVKGNTLRINKKLFYLLQDIEVHIKETKVLEEIEEKKKALIEFEEKESAPLSKKIKADLRIYQMTGFKWMQSLDQLGWGGCLADDMGLGKTLQTISFLQFVKEKYPGSCSLVIVPTSLLYNWEDELKKFAPALKYLIFYGADRKFTPEHLADNDIILTSYGTMRNDIDELKKHTFHYIILDESQAIKNPEARITKACLLLESKNRMILSGTPIQNNTFDLFAQMNFLNPGLLGNKNSFKNHFAIPIDKYQDKEAAQRLRKMTKPFILRRTKEKVAADLPDKSEIVLWCHMKAKQREVYEWYKDHFRNKLISKIESEGIKKSAFDILEGLTRLRQICDSPVLVQDPFRATNESAKIYELLRELKENTGEHKVLVFSQFTSMLTLIREELEKAKISFLYLDGQTPGKTRMELVKQFQQDESVKVFLISLKAGGVGLNLTAADYVYLVDPWWNPATESQAIDRTHRIGQTKKVFAYKMICKDSIEEKILHLQQKKKTLSEDLIGEESSFISKLTSEDIAFLFG